MNKNTINLIPPLLKKKYQFRQISSVINLSLVSLLIMVALTYVSIFITNYYLNQQLEETKSELSAQEIEIKKLSPIETSVNSINSKLIKISALKKDSKTWSKFLETFASYIPENVQIDSLQIDNKAKTVSIAGKAETRRDIVKLEVKLNTMEDLSGVEFTASTYNEQDDVYTFTMTGSLNK